MKEKGNNAGKKIKKWRDIMEKEYQKPKLEIEIFENEDIITLSTGNPAEKYFDEDWA